MTILIAVYIIMFFVTGFAAVKDAVDRDYKSIFGYEYSREIDYAIVTFAAVFWPVSLPLIYTIRAFEYMENYIKKGKKK